MGNLGAHGDLHRPECAHPPRAPRRGMGNLGAHGDAA